tara:strand:+ start:2716 stop:3420 length:705 start_codon:yes stop_codon:yes gene_type:complete
MKYVFFIFLSILTVFGENSYHGIVERNAFELTSEKPTQILPPVATLPLADVYLTGIARKDKIYTAYMVIKDKTQNKFLGLRAGEKKDGVEVMKIMKDTVFISYNGILQELTFKQNGFPSFVAKVASKQNTKDKREERGERGRSSSSSQRASKAPSRPSGPQVVRVPSRRSQIDPRIIEKGLEYLSKTEDNEKREYLLKRLESLQSGQHKIKSDIDTNERRRQYDEWRKSREKGK